MAEFNKVSIIGVGLIGASFGLAIKEKGLAGLIYGFGRNEENLKKARERGIIDQYSMEIKEVCSGADLIVLATPVGVFVEMVKRIIPYLKDGSILIDVGSVKGRLVYEIESMMPQGVHYLGTHPIAGSDKSGIDNARAELFKGARCIITPTEKTPEEVSKRVSHLWRELGCQIEFMDPYKHDEIYAAVSHFPHVVAYEIMKTIGDIDSEYIRYAGQGFRDTTRIALSSPELWRDIVIYNKENILKLLDLFSKNLEDIKRRLRENDADAIKEEFARAQELRKRI